MNVSRISYIGKMYENVDSLSVIYRASNAAANVPCFMASVHK